MAEQQFDTFVLQGPKEAPIFAGDEQDSIDELLVLDELVSQILLATARGDVAEARALQDEYLIHYPVELFDEVVARLRDGIRTNSHWLSKSSEVPNE